MLKAIVVLLLIPVFILWKAAVVDWLWGWHVVPLGVPALGMGTAVGLTALVSLLTIHAADREERELADSIVWGTFAPAFCLLVGWLAHVA